MEFNESKPPPRRAVEDKLRLLEAYVIVRSRLFSSYDLYAALREAREFFRQPAARRVVAANLDTILDAGCMESRTEFGLWRTKFVDLNRALWTQFPFFPQSCVDRKALFRETLIEIQVLLAIELFRHSHGEYPSSLDDLTPDFLPRRVWHDLFYDRSEEHYWLAVHSGILCSPPDARAVPDSWLSSQ